MHDNDQHKRSKAGPWLARLLLRTIQAGATLVLGVVVFAGCVVLAPAGALFIGLVLLFLAICVIFLMIAAALEALTQRHLLAKVRIRERKKP